MKLSHDIEMLKKIEELSEPILDSIPLEAIQNFKPYYDRYYENKYCIDFNSTSENNDILLRFHSNRLILVTLAEGHDIFRQKKVIDKINFSVNGINMLDITLSGKKKAGAKKNKKDSVLCYIKCEGDDKEYPVHACVPASLIEVNQMVLKNPELLTKSYKKLGYIGVLYPQCFGPNASAIDKMISKLNFLSEEEYRKYLDTRINSTGITQLDSDVINNA